MERLLYVTLADRAGSLFKRESGSVVTREMKIGQNNSVSDYIAQFLADKKVPAVFELSGGMIAFITDAISQLGVTSIVNVRHEQAAGFAAEGASRVLGLPSVALATSGPGATNLITAIGSAYFDSTPIVFITGQVNQAELRINPEQRQNGFQELDIVNVVKSITKFAVQVRTPEELILALEEAWNLSQDGRPGPVLVDIPIDVQQMRVNDRSLLSVASPQFVQLPSESIDFSEVTKLISQSKFPLILAGGGIRSADAVVDFRRFVESAGLPVVYSLMGVDALSSDSKFRVGLIGSYGNRWANRTLSKADTLLVLGSRLDVRQTGGSVASFMEGKKIIRVDIDDHELTGRIKADLDLKCSISEFLADEEIRKIRFDSSPFMELISTWKGQYPAEKEQTSEIMLNPNYLMHWISRVFSTSRGYVVDVGQHQMWAAQSLELTSDQRFLTSGGMGAMGFSIPAAIGSAVARDGKWVVIAGDGCVQLSIAELHTLKHYQLSVAVCVINNLQLGMVAQFQEENMDSRYVATRDGYSAPDFVEVSKAFGIPSIRIESDGDLRRAEEFIANWEDGPILLEFMVSNLAKALPKLARESQVRDL